MRFSNSITAVSLISILSAPSLAVSASEAADTATAASITNTAAVTAAPPVPFVGEKLAVSDISAALGRANINNRCNFPVYVYVCGQNPATCTAERTLPARTGRFEEVYSSTAGNGRSIKVGRTPGQVAKPILQFEYTNDGRGLVYYDVSNVNGNPFGPFGFKMTSERARCQERTCRPPGSHDVCPWVFDEPENGQVFNCGSANGIGVTLCG